jgi:hypothetical protein
MLLEPSPTPTSRALHAQKGVGWQPSRFLADRAEAERAFALAERLGSVNSAAQKLGTTWPSLRKAFARNGLGMPARNPAAVRQRAVAAARQRGGQPVAPPLDRVFAALNPDFLPARERPPAELYQWVRRDEEYAILGANVVVELNSESRARQPTSRAWAIIRRAERAHSWSVLGPHSMGRWRSSAGATGHDRWRESQVDHSPPRRPRAIRHRASGFEPLGPRGRTVVGEMVVEEWRIQRISYRRSWMIKLRAGW